MAPGTKSHLSSFISHLDGNFLHMKRKGACSGIQIQSQTPGYICSVIEDERLSSTFRVRITRDHNLHGSDWHQRLTQ